MKAVRSPFVGLGAAPLLRPPLLRALLLAALLLCGARSARADDHSAGERPAASEQPAAHEGQATNAAQSTHEQAASRSFWVAPTYQALFGDSFEPSSRHGLGARASYEFHITPTFNIGLALAYRVYPGSTSTQQLGYGALLKHFFSAAWSTEDGVYPYLDYGLLLQQTFVDERSGSAVSHDTRLGGGAVLRRWGAPLFIGVAAHYSRLQYFDVESRWIPYLEVEIGWAHAF